MYASIEELWIKLDWKLEKIPQCFGTFSIFQDAHNIFLDEI